MQPWTKSQTRALLQPFNVGVLALTMVIFTFQGVYTWHSLKLIGIALPVAMVFAQIGIFIFKRLTDDQFRRVPITMMLISDVALTLREVF